MKKSILIAACALTLLAAAANADDAALVAQAYPQQLDQRFHDLYQEDPADEPVRLTAFTRADLAGSGQRDFVVAAYTNGVDAFVRVLAANGSLVAESPRLGGITPGIAAVNLDGIGGEEIVATFGAATGNQTSWIYRWNGTSLVASTPVAVDEDGFAQTLLVDASWQDLDGDLSRELLVPSHVRPFTEENIVQSCTVYRWSGTDWVVTTPVTRALSYYRSTAKPLTEADSFRAAPGSYILRIVNGENDGTNRAGSAVVTLNGANVALPNDFNQQVRVIEVPVTLAAENTLSAELRGAPGSRILVVLRPAE